MSLLRQVTGFLKKSYVPSTFKCLSKSLSSDVDTTLNEQKSVSSTQGGYAQAFERFETLSNKEVEKPNQNFASLLRNSKFIDVNTFKLDNVRFYT